MDSLPRDVIRHIFSFIEFRGSDWLNVLLTCKNWLSEGKVVFDPSIRNNYAILWATENGMVNVVKELLKDKRVDPSVHLNHPLQVTHLIFASECYSFKCKHKTQLIVISTQIAIKRGHIDVVHELIRDPRVDPSVDENFAIRWASENGYATIVAELLKVDSSKPTFDTFTSLHYNLCSEASIRILK